MPKLPRVTSREMVRALARAGFVAHHQTGSHLIMLRRPSRRRAVVPMHNREILREAGITPTEFRKLLA